MNEWIPPIKSGLNGERSPEEDMEPWIDTLDDAHSPGVYVVKLSKPKNWEVVEERWANYTDKSMPDYVREAFDTRVVVYVGASKDVLSRLHQHLKDTNQSTAIAEVFPLHSLFDIYWYDSAEKAFDREHGIAMQLNNAYQSLYVHSR